MADNIAENIATFEIQYFKDTNILNGVINIVILLGIVEFSKIFRFIYRSEEKITLS